MTSAIALIPARGGSKRVPQKNIRKLNGHPLIAYTICAANGSGVFDRVLVSSDDTDTLSVASSYGADCIRRPDEYSGDTSPDIEWVKHALETVNHWPDKIWGANDAPFFDTFSILRPTSPFRLPSTIQRAFSEWRFATELGLHYTSLRAMEPTPVHPGKMWFVRPDEAVPMLPQPKDQPFHDSQYASLPEIYAQNASLEIAWVKTVEETGTISGNRVYPFITQGHEGFDINSEVDWMVAEQMITAGAEVPDVRTA